MRTSQLEVSKMHLRSSHSSRNECVVVKVSTGQNGRSGNPNTVVLTESAKSGEGEAAIAPSATNLNSKSSVATSGARDVYGGDSATKDQLQKLHSTEDLVAKPCNEY